LYCCKKNTEEYTTLNRFARILGTGLSSILFLIGMTPLGTLIYRFASGLKDDLLPFTVIPTLIVAIIPFVTSLVSFYRGVLIFRKETRVIANAVLLNSVVLMVLILSGPSLFSVPGGIIAALAYMVSMVVEALYLKSKVSMGYGVQADRTVRSPE